MVGVGLHHGLDGGLQSARELPLQLVRVNEVFHGLGHQLLELLRLEVGRKAPLLEVEDAVADDIFLIVLEHLLHEVLQSLRRDGEVQLCKGVAEVDVGQLVDVEGEIREVDEAAQIEAAAAEVEGTVQIEVEGVGIKREGILEGVGVDGEEAGQIEVAEALGLAEALAGEDVGGGVGHLLLHDVAVGSVLHDLLGQGGGVGDAGGEHGSGGGVVRLDNAHDGDVLAVLHQLLHIVLVVGLALPDAIGVVVDVGVGAVHQLELQAHQLVVAVGAEVAGDIDVLVLGKLLYHLVQLGGVPQTHGVEGVVGHSAVFAQHGDTFGGLFGPAAGLDFVLGLIKVTVGGQLIENAGVAAHAVHQVAGDRGGAGTRASQTQHREGGVRVDLMHTAVGVLPVDLGRDAVGILDGGGVIRNGGLVAVEIFL